MTNPWSSTTLLLLVPLCSIPHTFLQVEVQSSNSNLFVQLFVDEDM